MKSSRYLQKLTLVVTLFLAVTVLAQQPAPAPPSIPSTGFAGLDQYRARRIAVFTDDFGQLARYRDANAALKPPGQRARTGSFFSATPSPTSGISMNIFLASLTSIAALVDRPRRRCWSASGRM